MAIPAATPWITPTRRRHRDRQSALRRHQRRAAAGDIYISIENLRGTDFNDILTGDGQNNVIEGGVGDDALDGGANGFGIDTVSYEHATSAVTVDLSVVASQQNTQGAGSDTLTNFEGVRGSTFNDTLTGDGRQRAGRRCWR